MTGLIDSVNDSNIYGNPVNKLGPNRPYKERLFGEKDPNLSPIAIKTRN